MAKGHIDIRYCLTDEMIGDNMTKPFHGAKFDNLLIYLETSEIK